MTSLGTSEVASNVLRSSKAYRASFVLRLWQLRTPKMTATPPKYQLWHPTRGISFSPARSPVFAPQDARASNNAAVAANSAYTTESGSDSIDSSSLYPKLKEFSPPASEYTALDSDEAAPAAAEAVGDDAGENPADKPAKSTDTKIPDVLPVAALPFKMADDLFRNAKKAPAGSTSSFWSYAQYRGPTQEGAEQKVKVHYCRSRHTMERVCQQYFMNEKVLGFDLEWAPDSTKWQGVKRNVSLIQLASPSRIGLFHVALFADESDMVGPSFRTIMESPDITKVGVFIKGDATRLRNFLGVDSKGLIELSHLYRLVTYSPKGQYKNINKKLVPLATQVEHYLHLPLFKGHDVRASDWTKPLDMNQVIYSASDAYAGLQLYATLEYHREKLDPCPPRPYFAELGLPIRLADGAELVATDDTIADTTEETDLEVTAPTPKKSRSTKSKSPPGTKDSRVEIAEDRVARYKATHSNTEASVPHLRAYYMWHEQGLEPNIIARLLRDPPLKTHTVTGYILSAIQAEKLPVDTERLLQEVVSTIPDGTLKTRWPAVAAMVEAP
ncbi:hypothetical protein M426DRAFT_317653 [Hypoxylon sp. CI-4A]|nr:hypothetical protein M426DRAFT_317653 [Hypoxylon sp. CI-4A]